MDKETVEAVMQHASKGHRILLGRSHTGSVKVKIKHGPLGLFTTRFETDRVTFEEIKRGLREWRQSN